MREILEGIRVIDMTHFISGPYCTALLADMGAEVIKVEKPGTGDKNTRSAGPWKDGISLSFPSNNRNKKSMTIDTRNPEGIKLLKELIEKSDVLVENFRAGTMKKMGLDYETVKVINPKIIMVSITGFGQNGPMRDLPAFDGVISSFAGSTRIMSDHVERSMGAIHDYTAAVNSAFGIMLALYERERTGRGQFLDVAMLRCSSIFQNNLIADAYANPQGSPNNGEDSAPYGYVPVKDGWVYFHAGTDEFFAGLCELIDDPYLHQEKFKNDINMRVVYMNELLDIVKEWAKDMTCDELFDKFVKAGFPSAIVATPRRVLENKHLRETGDLVWMDVQGIEEKIPYIGFPVKMSEHPDISYNRAPFVGEHSEMILKDVLKKTDEEIDELRKSKIV